MTYSNDTTADISMSKTYRYCIQVLHRINVNDSNNWVGVGVTLPNGTKYIPLDVTDDRIFAAPGNCFLKTN